MRVVRTRVRWKKARRAISTRHPPIDLFERVAPPADWEALCELEARTNDRLHEMVGSIAAIPVSERRSGVGASYVMAPFAHPRAGRFNADFGVYYAGDSVQTALREWGHHMGRFFRASHLSAGEETDARVLTGAIEGYLVNVRSRPEFHHDSDYTASQRLGRDVKRKAQDGILFSSVRNPGGECIAAFRPSIVATPVQSSHHLLRFDGARMITATDYADGAVIDLRG